MTAALSWARRMTSDLRSALVRPGPPGLAGGARWVSIGAPAGGTVGGLLAIGGRSGRRSGTALVAGIGLGVITGVVLARVIDEIRRRRVPVSLAVDEPDAALDLMQAVRARGVHADMVRADDDPADPREPGGHQYALRYRAKDDRRVRAVLAEQQR